MNKVLLLVLVILVLLILVGAGGVYFFLLRETPESQEQPNVPEGVLFHTGDVFITNIKDSDQLLRTDVFVRIAEQHAPILQQNSELIRDRIIRVLRSFNEEDITGDDFQQLVRDQIKSDLQNTLNIDTISDIYFTEFVLQ